MKALIFGLLLASPPVAAWMLRNPDSLLASTAPAAAIQATAPAAAASMQVPVEVVAQGSAPQWIYVEMRSEAIPEPGVLPLVLLPGLLLWRRRRA